MVRARRRENMREGYLADRSRPLGSPEGALCTCFLPGASWPPINDRRDSITVMFRPCPAAALSPAPGGVPRVRQKHPRSSPSARAQPMRPFATGRFHRQGALSSTGAHGLLRGEPVCSSRHIGSRSRALARKSTASVTGAKRSGWRLISIGHDKNATVSPRPRPRRCIREGGCSRSCDLSHCRWGAPLDDERQEKGDERGRRRCRRLPPLADCLQVRPAVARTDGRSSFEREHGESRVTGAQPEDQISSRAAVARPAADSVTRMATSKGEGSQVAVSGFGAC